MLAKGMTDRVSLVRGGGVTENTQNKQGRERVCDLFGLMARELCVVLVVGCRALEKNGR